MNKKGFTLVELMVMTVAAVMLTVYTIPKVLDVLDTSKDELYKTQVSILEKSAKDYYLKHTEELPEDEKDARFLTIDDLAKENMIVTVINLLITVAYFATYAYYKNGQTIGKKLMHIKVESLDGKNPSHGTFIFRALFIYGVIASIISLIILQLIQADMYSYTVLVVETIQSILVFISALMITFRKDTRGLHDLIFKTKVVAVK